MVGLSFLLLMVVLVVTPAMLTGYIPDPPHVAHAPTYPESRSDVTLTIDRDGNYYLNKRPIPENAVGGALKRLFSSRPDEDVLYLFADKYLPYEVVRSAMDSGAESGARVIGLVVYETAARQ